MISQELFWTHTYPLLQAILNVEGDILELGCGHYSTALTAAVSGSRRVVCVDTDKDWVGPLAKKYKSTPIEFKSISHHHEEYEEQIKPYTKQKWGIVFVDHNIITQRGPDLLRFKNQAEVLVMHDSHLDNPNDGYCSFEAIQSFKYYIEHKLYWPQTAVMSEINDLSWLQ